MKSFTKVSLIVLMVAVLTALTTVSYGVTIATVPVGNPGNAGEWSGESHGGGGSNRICGAVADTYFIGKYAASNTEYAAFLTAVDPDGSNPNGLWDSAMGIQHAGGGVYNPTAGLEKRPVNNVSFFDILRFANWLHNGQGTGDTENGAYDLSLGDSVVRKPGATWFLPNEDEWYKAAYHKNNGVTGDYWNFPTDSDTAPTPVTSGTDPNTAVYGDTPAGPADVDNCGGLSPYGTMGQGGNTWEWNETLWTDPANNRGIRGGPWNASEILLHAAFRWRTITGDQSDTIGFRVATTVPEPGSITLLVMGLLALAFVPWRKRRGR